MVAPHRSRSRFVGVAAAFAPMLAVGLLPVTVGMGVAAEVVARVVSRPIALAFLVLVDLGAGALVARAAFRSRPHEGATGWHGEVGAVGLTVALIVAGVTEVASGSRAPDPLLPMWFIAFVWLFLFFPRVLGPWGLLRRALWIVGPLVTICTIVFVGTAGFFSYRFERAVPHLDRYVTSLEAGTPYHTGVDVGGFQIRARGRLPGCDAAFRIDGWHESDDRWIAWCPAGAPQGDGIDLLAGDWYEYQNR